MADRLGISASVLNLAEQWAQQPGVDDETRAEVAELLARKDYEGLIDRFYRPLRFGTGGMRGLMGAGTARINPYNVRRAAWAVAQVCLRPEAALGRRPRIAVSFDSRINSERYAEIAAGVLAAAGFEVWITAQMRPVPLLSFMVRWAGAEAGICLTASHNPSEYNGFKVYGRDGGQAVPPFDGAISQVFSGLADDQKIAEVPFYDGLASGAIRQVGEDLDRAYREAVLKAFVLTPPRPCSLEIVYTPLHGTGIYAVPSMLQAFGFNNLRIEPDQALPDGAFPTVPSPNPEDPRALERATRLAEQVSADLVLGSDPDADRLACLIRTRSGELQPLTGNEMLLALTLFLLEEAQRSGASLAHAYVVTTIVSTPLLQDICREAGVKIYHTLTGFKWTGALIEYLKKEEPASTFLCAGEESCGFLYTDTVRDKDAVSTAVLVARMVGELRAQGRDVEALLGAAYARHGYCCDSLRTLTLEGKRGAETIGSVMSTLRRAGWERLGDAACTGTVDYDAPERGHRQWLQDPRKPGSENVVQFHFADGSRLSIRPSGTEPKLKVYLTTRGLANSGQRHEDIRETHNRRMAEVMSRIEGWVHQQRGAS